MSLVKHVERVHTERELDCPDCGYNFQQKNAFKNRSDNEHEEIETPFVFKLWDPGGFNESSASNPCSFSRFWCLASSPPVS